MKPASNTRAATKVAAKAATKREQREASIERILQSALKLFILNGYKLATVDDIANEARLTKGAVYFYFPSKSALLLLLLDKVERLLVDEMVERVANAGPSFSDKLNAFVHGQSVLAAKQTELILLFILTLIEFNGAQNEIEARVREIYGRLCQAVEGIVHRGKIAGEIRADLTTKEIAAIVLALHNGTLLEWYCRPRDLSGSGLVRAFRNILLSGVVKQHSGAAGSQVHSV